MAAEELGRIQRLNTEDFKYNLNVGVFNGRVEISVFDSATKSAPIIKYLFTPSSLFKFKSIIRKILADPETKPIEISSWPYNRDLKVNEFKSSITVGRDQDKSIYLDLAGDKHKDPIRFFVIFDRSYRLQGMELPRQTQTEDGCNSLLVIFDALLTKSLDTIQQPRKFDGERSNDKQESFVSDPSMNTDIGF